MITLRFPLFTCFRFATVLLCAAIVSDVPAYATDQSGEQSIKAFDSGDYRAVEKILAKSKSVDDMILKARAAELIKATDSSYFMKLYEHPNDLRAQCWIAHACINGREYKRAHNILVEQAAQAPSSALVHTMMADCLGKSGENEAAMREFAIARKLDPSSEILLELQSDFFLKNLQTSEALEALEAMSLAHPKIALSFAKKAIIFDQLGQSERSVVECKKAIAVGAKYQLAQFLLAKFEYRQKKYALAIQDALKCLSLDPESDQAQNTRKLLANCYEEQKDYAREIEQLTSLLAGRRTQGFPLSGTQIEALLTRGQALLALGKAKEALADADEVLQTNRDSSSARLLRARSLAKAGLYAKSYEDYSLLAGHQFAPAVILQEKSEVLKHLKNSN